MSKTVFEKWIEVEEKSVDVYRIGYGLPVGADIEYADDITLMRALESKKEM